MFLDSPWRLLEIGLISVLLYTALIVSLRISGKRTLGDYTVYDWIISITIGSIAASTIVMRDTPLLNGYAGMLFFIVLQTLTAYLSVKSERFRRHLQGNPTLLYYKGHYLEDAMKRTRVTRTDISQSVRLKAGKSPDQVEAIVLEKNGKIALIEKLTEQGEKDLFRDLGIDSAEEIGIYKENAQKSL